MEPDRIEKNANPMLIAGLSMKCTSAEEMMNAPALWQKFGEYRGKIPRRKGNTSYGLCVDLEGGKGIEYVTGVEVSGTKNLPESFVTRQLASFTYAVFEHQGHVTEIPQTCDAIWKEWIPSSGAKKPEGADFFFERYGEGFDPQKGTGDIEIWVPVDI
jgi:AraC family transcriptional regulator